MTDSICLNCIDGYQLSNFVCVSLCDVGFVRDIRNSICIVCPYDCQKCDLLNNCLGCDSLSFRVLNKVTKRCVPMYGYFESNQTIATKCPSNCSTCQSLSVCLSCSLGFLRPDYQCGDCP